MNIKAEFYFDLTSLAEAAYALFITGKEPKISLVEAGFSDSQADDILSRWIIKTHVPNTATGFSMSLFEGSDGFVLGFRGTEPAQQWGKDLGADAAKAAYADIDFNGELTAHAIKKIKFSGAAI